MPLSIFRPLENLRTIHLYTNQLNRLRPEWFEGFFRLETLQMWGNNIPEIPPGTFKNLFNIRTMQIYNNNIRIIPSNAFPCLMQNLTTFDIRTNRIEAIDPKFFENAPNLNSVDFNQNLCNNRTYTNFRVNRTQYLSEFQQCFDAFDEVIGGVNTCNFIEHEIYGFTCELTDVEYEDGEFPIITDFSGCVNNSLVTGLIFKSSKIAKIPNEVFTTFPNLTYIQASGVGVVNVPSTECGENLKFINFANNSIATLDSDAFSGCLNIEEIILDTNCISRVQPCEETFVENLITLKKLSLKDCACVNEVFEIERTTIDEIEKAMKRCFKMWYLL